MASSTPRDAFVTMRSGQRREVSFHPSVTNVAWTDDLVDSQSEERLFVSGGSRRTHLQVGPPVIACGQGALDLSDADDESMDDLVNSTAGLRLKSPSSSSSPPPTNTGPSLSVPTQIRPSARSTRPSLFSRRAPAGPQPSMFSGEHGEDFDLWLDSVLCYADGLSGAPLMRLIRQFLTGFAASSFRDIIAAGPATQSTNHVIELLRDRVGYGMSTHEAKIAIDGLTLREFQDDVFRLAHQLRKLGRWAYPPSLYSNELLELTLMEKFIKALGLTWLQRKLLEQDFSNLQDATRYARSQLEIRRTVNSWNGQSSGRRFDVLGGRSQSGAAAAPVVPAFSDPASPARPSVPASRSPRESARAVDDSNTKCYRCQQFGHRRSSCPERPGN